MPISRTIRHIALPLFITSLSHLTPAAQGSDLIFVSSDGSFKTMEEQIAADEFSLEKFVALLKKRPIAVSSLPAALFTYTQEEVYFGKKLKFGLSRHLVREAQNDLCFAFLQSLLVDPRVQLLPSDVAWAASNASPGRGMEVLKLIFEHFEKRNDVTQMKDWGFGETSGSPQWFAVREGQTEALAYLLEKIPINLQSLAGFTVLAKITWQADARYRPALEFLLEAGADPNLATNEGDTPLIHAAFKQSFELVEALASDPRTNLNHVNNEGRDFKSYLQEKLPEHRPFLSILETRELFDDLEEEEEHAHFDKAPVSFLRDGAQLESGLSFDTTKVVHGYLTESDKVKHMLSQPLAQKQKILEEYSVLAKGSDAASVDEALRGFRRLTRLLDPKDGPHLKIRFRSFVRKMKKDAALRTYIAEHYVKIK